MLETTRRSKEKNPAKALLRQARYNAKSKGLPFDLELKDIEIPVKCPYLGCDLTTTYGQGRQWTNVSIDRIDNTKGYTKDNIQIISWRANQMKHTASLEELIKFANGILKLHGRDQPSNTSPQ